MKQAKVVGCLTSLSVPAMPNHAASVENSEVKSCVLDHKDDLSPLLTSQQRSPVTVVKDEPGISEERSRFGNAENLSHLESASDLKDFESSTIASFTSDAGIAKGENIVTRDYISDVMSVSETVYKCDLTDLQTQENVERLSVKQNPFSNAADFEHPVSASDFEATAVSCHTGTYDTHIEDSVPVSCITDISSVSESVCQRSRSKMTEQLPQVSNGEIQHPTDSSNCSESKSVRRRKQNFSFKELSLFLNGLEVYRGVIRCHASDRFIIDQKRKAWHIITEYVNKYTDQNIHRTVMDLKKKLMEMNTVTRKYTQAQALKKSEQQAPPWFYDRIVKLELHKRVQENKSDAADITQPVNAADLEAFTGSDDDLTPARLGGACDTNGRNLISLSEIAHEQLSASSTEKESEHFPVKDNETQHYTDYNLNSAQSNNTSKSQRRRKIQFSRKEQTLMLNGLEKYRGIIRRHNQNQRVAEQKRRAWRVITEYVNKNTDQNICRTTTELKRKLLEMNAVTRKCLQAQALKKSKQQAAPWYYDRMVKLGLYKRVLKGIKPDDAQIENGDSGDLALVGLENACDIDGHCSTSLSEIECEEQFLVRDKETDYHTNHAGSLQSGTKSKSKRTRKLSFSRKEHMLLLDGLEKYRSVIRSHIKDQHMAEQKRKAWRIITEYVNKNIDQNTRRTTRDLKKKMLGMNADARKYLQTLARKTSKKPAAPWFFDRIVKLELHKRIHNLYCKSDAVDLTQPATDSDFEGVGDSATNADISCSTKMSGTPACDSETGGYDDEAIVVSETVCELSSSKPEAEEMFDFEQSPVGMTSVAETACELSSSRSVEKLEQSPITIASQSVAETVCQYSSPRTEEQCEQFPVSITSYDCELSSSRPEEKLELVEESVVTRTSAAETACQHSSSGIEEFKPEQSPISGTSCDYELSSSRTVEVPEQFHGAETVCELSSSKTKETFGQLHAGNTETKDSSSSTARSKSKPKSGKWIRRQNFSHKELTLFLKGLEVYKGVIRSHIRNQHMTEQKTRAWHIITEYVNRNSDQNVRRTAMDLKKKLLEMNAMTRKYTQALLKKKKMEAPWYYDHIMKLELYKPVHGNALNEDKLELNHADKANGLNSSPSEFKTFAAVDETDGNLAEATDIEENATELMVIQDHINKVAESLQVLRKYGVEAGALVVRNGQLLSYGSDCRVLLARQDSMDGDLTRKNASAAPGFSSTMPVTASSERKPSAVAEDPAILEFASAEGTFSDDCTEVPGSSTPQSDLVQELEELARDFDDDSQTDHLKLTLEAAEEAEREKAAKGQAALEIDLILQEMDVVVTGAATKSSKRGKRKSGRSKTPACCEICGVTLSSRSNLKKHIELHTGVNRKRFQCETCGETFTSKSYMEIHQRRHTGERPLKCEYCGEGFIHHMYLRIHQRRHTGERFTCETCGASFMQRNKLTVHLRKHTGEKPYACDECGQRFHYNGLLLNHIRQHHTAEKPFKCRVCSKSFVQASKLKLHMRIHTGEKPYACEQCGKMFKRSDALGEHVKHVHSVSKCFA